MTWSGPGRPDSSETGEGAVELLIRCDDLGVMRFSVSFDVDATRPARGVCADKSGVQSFDLASVSPPSADEYTFPRFWPASGLSPNPQLIFV
jgi:hypothetical protein